MKDQIETRHATDDDVTELCLILNEIIEIGGTTAYESNLDETEFRAHFVNGVDCISCIVAKNDEFILGFQALSIRSDLPDGWLDIATFARTNPKVKGVGITLFNSSKLFLQDKKYTHINASIRADNRSGLAYYTKIGFIDYATRKAVPLIDGTPIDRMSKQFDIMQS